MSCEWQVLLLLSSWQDQVVHQPLISNVLVDVYTGEMIFRLKVEKTKYEMVLDERTLPQDMLDLDIAQMDRDFETWARTKLWRPELGPNRDETGRPVLMAEYIQYLSSQHGPDSSEKARRRVEEKLEA
jgi:hypothetical protein